MPLAVSREPVRRGAQLRPMTSSSGLPLADASARLRGVPGFPGRPGRPPKRPRPESSGPVGHVERHVRRPTADEVCEKSNPTGVRPQDGVTSGPKPGSEPRLVSVKIAADYLAVSPWTVRDLIASGTLPRVSLPGVRRVLVAMIDIEQLIVRSRTRVT